MHRIELAAWHDGRAPGTQTEVTEDELRDLVKDGRVAKVLAPQDTTPPTTATPAPEAAVAAEPAPSTSEATGGPSAEPMPEASEAPAPAAAPRRKGR
ncbi:hypothetical protein KVH22_25450 [Streptomyces olivaceus]|uniref:hypothetical protein n=1 Tax=Streptomyces olivaceus TaxID=47716 RepID=UPI001CCDC0EA|nr:hypothetical protein [Streptomyces olivaceus]MBZ6258865.1 hypothetical protein [Streptomyces olivaceus]